MIQLTIKHLHNSLLNLHCICFTYLKNQKYIDSLALAAPAMQGSLMSVAEAPTMTLTTLTLRMALTRPAVPMPAAAPIPAVIIAYIKR